MIPWWKRLFDEDWQRLSEGKEREAPRTVAFLRRAMKLRPGMRLLDMGCGQGRLAVPLARLGLRVTGVDVSAAQIREARRRARKAAVAAEWVRADGRRYRSRRKFDRAICMWTSFGYFDSEEDDEMLMRAMALALKRGGLLCLEVKHLEGLVCDFEPHGRYPIDGGRGTLTCRRRFDPLAGRARDEWTIRLPAEKSGGRPRLRRVEISVRAYSTRELVLMMRRCRLEPVRAFAGAPGPPLTIASPRLALLARKV